MVINSHQCPGYFHVTNPHDTDQVKGIDPDPETGCEKILCDSPTLFNPRYQATPLRNVAIKHWVLSVDGQPAWVQGGAKWGLLVLLFLRLPADAEMMCDCCNQFWAIAMGRLGYFRHLVKITTEYSWWIAGMEEQLLGKNRFTAGFPQVY